MVAPIVVAVISGASALLSGGGVAVYCKNKYQKEIFKLQDEVSSLQRNINNNNERLAAKQKNVEDLQRKIFERDTLINEFVVQENETDSLLQKIKKEIEEKNAFWSKIVSTLQTKLLKFKDERDKLIEKLEKVELDAYEIEGKIAELISIKEEKLNEIIRLEEEGIIE